MTDVVVVLDPAFGERLEPLVALAPVWIVDSDINKATYERLRFGHEDLDHREKGAITNFEVLDKDNPVKGFLDIMPAVEIHHGHAEGKELVFPNGFVLEVIGVSLSADITKTLRESYGFTSFVEAPDGFEASKH